MCGLSIKLWKLNNKLYLSDNIHVFHLIIMDYDRFDSLLTIDNKSNMNGLTSIEPDTKIVVYFIVCFENNYLSVAWYANFFDINNFIHESAIQENWTESLRLLIRYQLCNTNVIILIDWFIVFNCFYEISSHSEFYECDLYGKIRSKKITHRLSEL